MSHTTNGSDHLQEPALRYARQDFPIIRDSVTVGEALAGIIPTRRLLTATPERTIADVMITDVITISDRATVQDACEMFVKHKCFAFPIVDDLNHMRGIIDIGFFSEETISVAERQKIGDIFELIGFGMAQLQGRSAFGVLRYRLPWLLTMVASGIICAMLANGYETTLSQNLAQIIESGLLEGLDNVRAEQIAHLKIRDEVLA